MRFFVWDIRQPPPGVDQLDFRPHFLVIATLVPAFITVCMLLLTQPLALVLWYLAFLSAMACAIAGFVVKMLPSNELTTGVPADVFFVAGLAGLALCICLALVHWCFENRAKSKFYALHPTATPAQREYLRWRKVQVAYEQPRSWAALAAHLLIIAACVLLALLAYEKIQVADSSGGGANELETVVGPVQTLGRMLGPVFIALALFTLLHFILVLSAAGRSFILALVILMRDHAMRLILLLLNLAYIPVINTTISAFICVDGECEPGTVFPDREVRQDDAAVTFARLDSMCIPCPFFNTTLCPADLEICVSDPDSRLAVDLSLSCNFQILPYYMPAAAMMCLGFVIGVPIVYYAIIRRATSLTAKMPIDGRNDGERWVVRTGVSMNSIKGVFAPFVYNQRYFRLVQVLRALVVVTVPLAILPYSVGKEITLLTFATVHTLFAAYVLVAQPYISRRDNMALLGLTLANVFNACFAAYEYYNVGSLSDLADSAVTSVIAVNIFLPVFFTLVGFLLSRRLARKADEYVRSGRRVPIKNDRLQYKVARRTRIPILQAHYRLFRLAEKVSLLRHEMMVYKAKGRRIVGNGTSTEEASRAALNPNIGTSMAMMLTPKTIKSGGVRAWGKRMMSDDQVTDLREGLRESSARRIQALWRGFLTRRALRMAKRIEVADIEISRASLVRIGLLFKVIGVVAFLSFSWCLTGIISSSTQSKFIPHLPLRKDYSVDYMYEHEFAGLSDWDSFTALCCCSVGDPTDLYPVREEWKCDTGHVKEKAREAYVDGELHSGLALRGLCALEHNEGVTEPVYEEIHSDAFNFFHVDVVDGVFEGDEPTEYELYRLW